MDLQSAFELKERLEAFFGPYTRLGRRQFALGVAVPAQGAQYAIAVRAPSAAELRSEDLQDIRTAAAGEIDVRYTGPIIALGGGAGVGSSHLAIGSSVAHYRCSAGTLGFFGRSNRDQTIGLVSNNHVLALCDEGMDGDEILHPAPSDGGKRPHDVVGHLVGGYPRLKRSGVTVDCAFARLLEGKAYEPALPGRGRTLSLTLAAPLDDPDVSKIGRTTGETNGRITAIALDGVEVDYAFGVMRFDGQMEIQSASDTPFARPGDSGSLVFSRAGCHPAGLVFACSAAGGAGNLGLTYANAIDDVLIALDVTLLA